MTSTPSYRPRTLEGVLERLLGAFPVVVLTGARQAGKSTLARHLPSAARREYRTLDDPSQEERARRDPVAFVEGLPGAATLDEVQRAPDLLRAIKLAVDEDRRPGRFLLTGSSNLLLMARVSETLAGRAVYLTLGPMTEREKRRAPPAEGWDWLMEALRPAELVKRAGRAGPPADWASAALQGGMPPVLDLAAGHRPAWFEGYVQTYLERDLRQFSGIGALFDFRRLMQMAALRIGRPLNQANLARDAALSAPTAHRWLNLLEAGYQFVRIPAFAVNRSRRLTKAPKLYGADPGLASFLAGIHDPGVLRASPLAGALLENLVLAQLMAWRETRSPRPDILTWRTVSGLEVDFVIEAPGRWIPVEVKAATRVHASDARGVEAFVSEYPEEAPFGVVLHTGEEAAMLSGKTAALPLSRFL